jgi:hypothetical protein
VELHNLYISPNIIRYIRSRKMRWVGQVAHMEEERKVYKFLVGKPEARRPLGSLMHRWEDGIKVDLREIGWEGVEWVLPAEDRDWWLALVITVMNVWVLAPRS